MLTLGTTVRGEIETFTVAAHNTANDTFVLKGEDGALWSVRGSDIGATNDGFVIGEEVYDTPA